MKLKIGKNSSCHILYVNIHTYISVVLALSLASTLKRCDVEASLTIMCLSSLFLSSNLEPKTWNKRYQGV